MNLKKDHQRGSPAVHTECGCCESLSKNLGPVPKTTKKSPEFEMEKQLADKEPVFDTRLSSVNALTMEEPPDALHAVSTWKGQEGGWTCIRTVMDSGAVDSVAPSTMAPGVSIVPSPGSRRGQNYLSASNERIPNLGQQTLEIKTRERTRRRRSRLRMSPGP